MAMLLGITSEEVSLFPDWAYSFTETQEKHINRSVRGNLGVFVNSPTFTRLQIPVSYVSSSDKSIINSYWQTGTTIHLIENEDNPTVVHTVRIVGKEEPFPTFIKPYAFQEYSGTILLETV